MLGLLIKIFICFMNIVYVFLKLLPTKNKITMISRQSNKINVDFKLLKKELEKKHEVVCLCKTLDGGINSTFPTKIKYVFHMFRQMYHLATSKVCLLDSFCPVVSILKHKKKLVIIQMWHSIGTMKKFGYSILSKEEGSNFKIAKAMKMHKNYTVVYASSKNYAQNIAKGFGIPPEKVKIFTLPRVDLLNNKIYEKKIKTKIYEKYPQLKEKENVLYAPTFRKKEKELKKNIDKLINKMDFNKYNLIIKLHPLSKITICSDKAIIDKKFTTFEMLFITNKLISDYSCIIYEAGIRNIPLYFYLFDKNDYEVVRGIELKYNELPGYQTESAKKLCLYLEKKYDMNYLKKFIKKYVSNTKNCTYKIVKNIEKFMK